MSPRWRAILPNRCFAKIPTASASRSIPLSIQANSVRPTRPFAMGFWSTTASTVTVGRRLSLTWESIRPRRRKSLPMRSPTTPMSMIFWLQWSSMLHPSRFGCRAGGDNPLRSPAKVSSSSPARWGHPIGFLQPNVCVGGRWYEFGATAVGFGKLSKSRRSRALSSPSTRKTGRPGPWSGVSILVATSSIM